MADGLTKTFQISFLYVNRSDIRVFLNDTETTAFTWITNGLIQLTAVPAAGVKVTIRRDTRADTSEISFQSVMPSPSTLTRAFRKVLYVAQEAMQRASDLADKVTSSAASLTALLTAEAKTRADADATERDARVAADNTEVQQRQAAIADLQDKLSTAVAGQIPDGTLTGAKFRPGSISSDSLADAAVTTAKMRDLAVTSEKLAAQAVLSTHIGNGAVGEAQVSQITGGKVFTAASIPGAASPFWRSVHDRAYETIIASDYGTKGDGTARRLLDDYPTLAAAQAVYPWVTSLDLTLDYVGLQSAINVANARSGGTVVIPRGTYRLRGQTLDLTGVNAVRLLGAGMNATILDAGGPANAVIANNAMSYHNAIEHLTISSSVTRTGGWMLLFADERRLLMNRVKVRDYLNGIHFILGEVNFLTECIIDAPSAAGGTGLHIGESRQNNGLAGCALMNCFIRGNNSEAFNAPIAGKGIIIQDFDGVVLFNTDIGQFVDNCLYVLPSTRSWNHYFVNSYFDVTTNGDCVYVGGAGSKNEWQFTGCWFGGAGRSSGASQAAGSSNGAGLRLAAEGSYQDIILTGCRHYQNAGPGLFVQTPEADLTMSGGTFYGNGYLSNLLPHTLYLNPNAQQTKGMTVSGCRFAGNAGWDVYLEANSRHNLFTGCKFQNGILRAAAVLNMATVSGCVENVSRDLPSNAGGITPTLGAKGFSVTGNNSFSFISPTYTDHVITLLFYGTLTVNSKAQGGNLVLNGNINAVPGTSLTLMQWPDGTWRQVAQSMAG